MTIKPKRLASCAVTALLLVGCLSYADAAPKRHKVVHHKTQPSHARAPVPALNTNLGDYDPWGRPARSGCTWSRMQVPTSQGLRWVAMEECEPEFDW